MLLVWWYSSLIECVWFWSAPIVYCLIFDLIFWLAVTVPDNKQQWGNALYTSGITWMHSTCGELRTDNYWFLFPYSWCVCVVNVGWASSIVDRVSTFKWISMLKFFNCNFYVGKRMACSIVYFNTTRFVSNAPRWTARVVFCMLSRYYT